MPYSVNYIDKNDYLLASTAGKLTTPETVQKYTQGLLNTALKRKYVRMLVDEQDLDVWLDTYDTIKVVDALSQALPSGRNVRIAAVSSPEKSPDYKIYETIFQNRSFNYRAFVTEKEALNWLLA